MFVKQNNKCGLNLIKGPADEPEGVPMRVLHVTEEYTTVQLPNSSWEQISKEQNAGGARGRVKSVGTSRTHSLDRAAAARMVRAAAEARSASAAARGPPTAAAPRGQSEQEGPVQRPVCRGKKV